MLVFTDDGGGMSPERMRHMFQLAGSEKSEADAEMIGRCESAVSAHRT